MNERKERIKKAEKVEMLETERRNLKRKGKAEMEPKKQNKEFELCTWYSVVN
jgi:hypothetical protein